MESKVESEMNTGIVEGFIGFRKRFLAHCWMHCQFPSYYDPLNRNLKS